MKATVVRFERLFNRGNFEHEKIAIEIQLEEGDTAKAALEKAKSFVETNSHKGLSQIHHAQMIAANPDNFSYKEVTEAKEYIEKYNSENEGTF